ncbi:hypothetical protein FOZ62_023899, partial [Perkinsus olseni]
MPKDGKPDAEWRKILTDFAASKARTMPRGRAPPKTSKWYGEVQKILKCPFGTSHPFKPKEVRGCECGYHPTVKDDTKVSEPSKATIGGAIPVASIAGTNLERLMSKELSAAMPRKPESLTVADVRDVIAWQIRKGFIDLYIYGPTSGSCPSCKDCSMRANAVSRMKMVYRQGWPCYLIGIDLKCRSCGAHCLSFDSSYRATLAKRLQPFPFIVSGSAMPVCKKLILALRMGVAAKVLEEQIRATIRSEYMTRKREYESAAAAKLALKLAGSFEPFPPFPEEYVAKSPALLQAFLVDYDRNRDDLRREQAALVSATAIAIDNQRKVVKRTKVDVTKGEAGTQSLTAVGDGGLILGYYVVPDVGRISMKLAMEELVERHGPDGPKLLYVDTGCCNGKLSTEELRRASRAQQYDWEKHFKKKLDVMHLILRIGRETNSEHPRRRQFLKQISKSIFRDSEEDTSRLEEARAKANLNLTDEQKRIDRYKYVRRTIGDPRSTCAKLLLVVKAHIALDKVAAKQCKAVGMKTEAVTVASPSYPLITHAVKNAVMNQCIHILNGCVADEGIAYVQVGEADYRNTGVVLPLYKSLRGTSKVESLHSTLDRAFYSMRNFRTKVFDARASWHIANYNRRRLMALGKSAIPCGVAPSEDDDAVLAPPEAATKLMLGFEYARAAMGDVMTLELEGEPTPDDDVVPVEGEMVDDTDDLSDMEDPNDGTDDPILGVDLSQGIEEDDLQKLDSALDSMIAHTDTAKKAETPLPNKPTHLGDIESLCTPIARKAEVTSQWSQPTGELASARRTSHRDVGRRRALGGSLVEVTPDFNDRMTKLWTDIWAKSTSGARLSAQLVRSALVEYNTHLARDVTEDQPGWEPLLPVSYAGALKWMKDMQAKCHQSATTGTFTQEGVDIAKDLESVLQVPTLLTLAASTTTTGTEDAPDDLPQAPSVETMDLISGQAENEQFRRHQTPQQKRRRQDPLVEDRDRQRSARERRRRAELEVARLGLDVPQQLPKGERRCPLCNLSRGGEHIVKNNQVLYCPHADPTIVKEEYEEGRKAAELARYERYNKK